MKSKVILFFLLLLSLTVTAQDVKRILLHGVVVSDSLDVENIVIKNTTSKRMTVTDRKGSFSMFVKEKDTLVFSAISFNSMVLIITKAHLDDDMVTVRLSVKINELDEVIVRPYTLTGNLETDSKRLKLKTVDVKSSDVDFSNPVPNYSPVDNALAQITPGSGNSWRGIDFVALGKKTKEAVFKPKAKREKVEYVSEKIFADAVKEKFDPQFFTDNLKLKPEEVDLFLAYCDTATPESRELLNPKNEFKLIEFLLKKSEEYHKNNR